MGTPLTEQQKQMETLIAKAEAAERRARFSELRLRALEAEITALHRYLAQIRKRPGCAITLYRKMQIVPMRIALQIKRTIKRYVR
jgi:hypothetical protein